MDFENSLLTFDAFADNLTDSVKNQLLKENTDILPIPDGYVHRNTKWMFV